MAELRGLDIDTAPDIVRNDSELFWTLVPNTRLPDDAWPFHGIIANGMSLREDHEIPLQKPAGQLRILFLGDSCTFGYGVAHDQSFAHIAESLIADESRFSSVECINAGVPGYSLYQGWRYLQLHGINLDPDLIVLNFGWNDYSQWDNRSDEDHYRAHRDATPPGPLTHSQLCTRLWAAAQTTESISAGSRPRVLPNEFATLLKRTQMLAQSRGIDVLALVWPMRANTDPATPPDMRTALQAELITFGEPDPRADRGDAPGVIDLVPLARRLVAERGVDAVYYDNGHVTAPVHAAFAQAIVDTLTPWLDARQ